MKNEDITLLLKKPDLDPAENKSYRPILNLSVLSKTLERLVAHQLLNYLNAADLMPNLQSAYRANPSSDTALLEVLADTLRAVDSRDLAARPFRRLRHGGPRNTAASSEAIVRSRRPCARLVPVLPQRSISIHWY